ncbi:uncharacterized protein N7482_010457 [Penicillium canariense]|uniref:Ubiquitin carboxyl-terminal hydrolase 19 n=1 Tax=Penicillium canariense TaxID=189055 RepID=A0A9W9LEI4_9EURO|nr:uncharacterized protein N7482_010457 [Penicillium canariense]KAJ5151205.1 hypothetical protein N7482_010457 [Penicillium canariense]
MDAQYPFASRDDLWRVFDELKELHLAQYSQGERIARLERRRDEDARLKNVWGAPLSPFPTPIGSSIQTETTFNSPPEPFKGFDQGQHQATTSSAGGLDGEEEPRRGASRANSVRFDESAIHGYYGQANRSSTELPLRTGSGMGSHPLTERSLSHRSDGRQSSPGVSLHSARTNSLGLDTSSRVMSSSLGESPLTPPPGLFLLGPVPCIIRCWLTTDYSNDSLLYAAVCSGSFTSSLGSCMVRKLGLEGEVDHDEDGRPSIKLALYLPEASVHQSSSRSSSPMPQLPSLTIRFYVRETDHADESIQIILGSDVLRSHNADVLFSQDKIIMVDDDHHRVSVPLVRPEKDWVFKFLHTAPDTSHPEFRQSSLVNGHPPGGVVGRPTQIPQSTSAPASTRVSIGEADDTKKPQLQDTSTSSEDGETPSNVTAAALSSSKPEAAGIWKSWRREPKPEPSHENNSKARPMTVLKPTKPATRGSSAVATPTSNTAENVQLTARSSSDGSTQSSAPNPIGGASAFGWLNAASRATANAK